MGCHAAHGLHKSKVLTLIVVLMADAPGLGNGTIRSIVPQACTMQPGLEPWLFTSACRLSA